MAVPTVSSSIRSHNVFDSILAALMIVAAVWFLIFIHQRTGTGSFSAYEFSVRLPTAAGLIPGSDVRVAGMKVGTVATLDLEPKSYRALVRLRVRADLGLPLDSSIAIVTPMMGSSYLAITPGQSKGQVKPGWLLSAPRGTLEVPQAGRIPSS